MKVYVEPTIKGLKKAINNIHHKTKDATLTWRKAIGKSQRKAARRYSKKIINRNIDYYYLEY